MTRRHIALGLAAALCLGTGGALAASGQAKVAGADLPPAVAEAVAKAMPGMTVSEAEPKEREGRRYYDVEGRTADGQEIELDLLEEGGAWRVVEIQRDIPWSAAPAPVRTAAAGASKRFEPARVIESRQTDGSTVYELFAPGEPKTPAVEVMLRDGRAQVLKEVWPH